MIKHFLQILICLLFWSNLAISQFDFTKDSAFVKLIDDLPSKQPFDTLYKYKKVKEDTYVYLADQSDIYQLFGWNVSSRHRYIDFEKYHIVGQFTCKQCLIDCLKYKDHYNSCHRNSCIMKWVWIMRENEKAFTKLNAVMRPSLTEEEKTAYKRIYHDTVLRSATQQDRSVWITHSGGDCHAKFKHVMYTDNYYPVLLLKEWNYYGGCRAGGSWEYAFEFVMPQGIEQQTKLRVLVDRYSP